MARRPIPPILGASRSRGPRPAPTSRRDGMPMSQDVPIAPSPSSPAARTPRVSVLVPYRVGGGVERERNWAFVRTLYERKHPAWEVVTAPGPDGEFSRAGAICEAALRASGEVFVVADSDVWSEGLKPAVDAVAKGAHWATPATRVVRMGPLAAENATQGTPFSDEGGVTESKVPCGGAVVLSRKAFCRVPPDTRFVGWGAEDSAWALALNALFGEPIQIATRLWHLWHPAAPDAGKPSATTLTLLERYHKARRDAQAMESLVREAGALRSTARALSSQSRPRVLILADVPTWAWARKAQALKKHLCNRFDIEIVYSSDHSTGEILAARNYDLLHTFEVGQLQSAGIPSGVSLTTGITAHVWQTWERAHGTGTVRRWAERAAAFHANSRLLQHEISGYLSRHVHYVPNGVDETLFHRTRPRNSKKLVVGFVGKPNPRKGVAVVAEACRRATVELRVVERRAQNALSPEEMREFYQGIHVLAVSSDMDGTPNPALEAAACECAVVSNRIGNMPEFITEGVNGILTERTVESLTSAIYALSRKPIAEVEAMGRAARATVEREWTWAIQAENYANMWHEVLR